jgi:putative membrane protein insertion efficiency factor
MRAAMIAVLRGYKLFLSPLLPPMCRFEPTCSVYTMEAVEKYGVVRGTWLGVRRLSRCHVFNPGGWDPVP